MSLASNLRDSFSRYIIAWKLCTTMKAEDVTDTLKLALQGSGLDQATVMHRPRLLSDNGSSYVSGDLAKWLEAAGHVTYAWCALSSDDTGENRAPFWSLVYALACTTSVSTLLPVLNRTRFICRQQSVHGSWVRKKVVVTTMEPSRSHRVARSACVYKYQLATQVDRTSNTASS